MPEVIDLISSTPPPSSNLLKQRSSTTAPHISSPASASRNPFNFDDIDDSALAYDDLNKPSKRRRISDDVLDYTADTAELTNDVFLFSDEDLGSPVAGPSKSKTTAWDDSDPIVFTSSAPEPKTRDPEPPRKTGYSRQETITIESDDGEDSREERRKDEIQEFSDQLAMPDLDELLEFDESSNRNTHSSLSSRTANLLANLDSRSKVGGCTGGMGKRSRTEKILLSDDLDEPPPPPQPVRKKTSKLTAAEKDAKARERGAVKARREEERQRERERKQQLKEEKARERQLAADISEVNKLKVDKKDSTPEMIIAVASSLEGSSVGNQTVEFMKRLGVECSFFSSPIPNVVKWRRKVVARFNETAGYWEPCPHYISEEEHVLCLLTAQEFVDMVISSDSETETLEAHVTRIKTVYRNCKPIYLIEGLTAWMRKNKNSRNRAFQAEVLRQMEPESSSTTNPPAPARQSRKKQNKPENTPPVDDDEIEDALLNLQVTHSCLIHHTNAPAESADWIKNFTEHVSTIPYRRERMEGNDSAFCMDVGQVKTGDDKPDTFVKMLQEVNRITASMAYGIMAEYPTVTDLVRGLKAHGPSMLEDVRVCLDTPFLLLRFMLISCSCSRNPPTKTAP